MSRTHNPPKLLLDTCAVIWLANGESLATDIVGAIVQAGLSARVFVLPVESAIRAAPFTPEIAINASCLPGNLHPDPADRLLIATAWHLGTPLVTRDPKIIAYAGQGFVEVLPC